ncbi:hypothetical protein SAMN05216567_110103 [Variovorax sp. OK605]|jgi:hypothetical protein|uniref:hypothetical protein n=1 Tax=Variovorax sp. OK605 TaxID=1855317 RepID=UPI0008EC3A7E|nr:hypothetical protein [Variovorax sp. OK605]SFP97874.1 hypothetical protein SAMN05216567_110103 [Variovorax sp. OK605]
MADSSSSSSRAAHAGAQFKPFAWSLLEGLDHRARQRAAFLNDARDVIDGAHTLMQLLAWDEERGDAVGSLLDTTHRASLQRLVIASLGMLHADIEVQCEALSAPRP